jgi:hypothetical protein
MSEREEGTPSGRVTRGSNVQRRRPLSFFLFCFALARHRIVTMFSRSVARLIAARPSPASAARALAPSATSPSAGAPARFFAPPAKHNQLIQRAFSNSAGELLPVAQHITCRLLTDDSRLTSFRRLLTALAHGGKGRPKKGEG